MTLRLYATSFESGTHSRRHWNPWFVFINRSDFLTFVSPQPCSLRSSFCLILGCQSCLRNGRFDFPIIRNSHHDFLDQPSNFRQEGFQVNEMQYYIVDVLTQPCEFALKCQSLLFNVINFNHLEFLSALMTISAVRFLQGINLTYSSLSALTLKTSWSNSEEKISSVPSSDESDVDWSTIRDDSRSFSFIICTWVITS